MPDYGYLFDDNNLPKTIISRLLFIKNNRLSLPGEHYYVGLDSDVGNVYFMHEKAYDKSFCPDAGLRLLSLFRFWNMIQYFYPDRHLIPDGWNQQLSKLIPVFCNANTALSYEFACLQLLCALHDTHASLNRDPTVNQHPLLRFNLQFVEGKLVVTSGCHDSVFDNDALICGDVIEKIDNIPVNSLAREYVRFMPASNYSRKLYDLATNHAGFLFSSPAPPAIYNGDDLQLLREGKPLHITLNSKNCKPDYRDGHLNDFRSYKIIENNIGYILPACLETNDLDSIKVRLNNTKGIIIDMRCYPHVFIPYSFGAWLKPKLSPFAACSVANIDIPGLFEIGYNLLNGGDSTSHYRGKLVIIVNQSTISQAEFTTMALATTPGAMVIGDTTAGADGNIVHVILPGGINTQFSGIGIYYPDGSETQGVGVKIDHIVRSTIKGIKEGRDEQLEYAIDLINKNN